MSQGAGEYYKMKTWIDGFMSIPFNIYQTLPVNISVIPLKSVKISWKTQKIH